MSRPKNHRELATTQAVGARTVVMDRPPEMTMVPGPPSKRTIPPMRPARHATSATPSIMTTTVLLSRGQPRPAAPPPAPAPLVSLQGQPPALPAMPVRPPPIPGPSAGAPPVPLPKPMPARTRMVDLRDALASQGLPPLPPAFLHPPQPCAPTGAAAPASLLSMPRSLSPWMRVGRERRTLLVAAGGALLLLMLLLMPQLMGESEAEVLEQHAPANASHVATSVPASAVPASSPDPLPGSRTDASQRAARHPAPDAKALATPDPTSGTEAPGSITEAQAGALLLSGQRAQALAGYRALAQRPGAHPGIEAMVIVLEQKVNPL